MTKPYIKKYHLIIEIISYVILIAALIVAIVKLGKYDGRVPTHINISGEVDKYASASSLIAMPIVMLIVNLTMSAIAHFMPASSFNMPFKVKPGRELPVYADVILMLVLMIFAFAAFTLFYVLAISAPEKIMVIGSTVMGIVVGLIIVLTVIKGAMDNR